MIKMFSRFFAIAGSHAARIKAAFVFSFVKSMLSKASVVLAFFLLGAFYDGTADARLCASLGIATATCLAVQAICAHTADRLQSSAGYLVMAEKRIELGEHLRRMPMGYFSQGNIGKISSVLSTDLVFIEETATTVMADLLGNVFSQVIMLAFLFWVNVWLGVAGLAVLGVVLLVVRRQQAEARAGSAVRQEQSENLTRAVIDFVEGMGVIKSYNLLGEKSAELTANFDRSCDENIAFEKVMARYALILNAVYGLGSVAVLGIGLALTGEGQLATPMAVGLMLFVLDVFGPVRAFNAESTRLTIMNACLDRFEQVMAEAELPDTGTAHIPDAARAKALGVPEVEFEDVRFAYDEKDVIRGLSFAQPRGTMYALVGPSGGGKTTTANLLARFWDVAGGHVRVRGADVRDVPLAELMDHVSMVFQQVYLFRDTVYNNILMGRPDATRAEVEEAARKARAYDFIMGLPQGFDTPVGEGGANLSGGERQRISIARCILKDAPVVILDEATASVDADNEVYIQQAIGELCQGKTLLVIAHRLNTVKGADKILVVQDGRIAQQGTHDELMAQGGTYRSFVTAREHETGWNRRSKGAPAA